MHLKALFLIVLASFLISCQEQENETPCPSEVNVRFVNKLQREITISIDTQEIYLPKDTSIRLVPSGGFDWQSKLNAITLVGSVDPIEKDSCHESIAKTIIISDDNITQDSRDNFIGKYLIICNWRDQNSSPPYNFLSGTDTVNVVVSKYGFNEIKITHLIYSPYYMDSDSCFVWGAYSFKYSAHGCFIPSADSIRFSAYKYPEYRVGCTGKKME